MKIGYFENDLDFELVSNTLIYFIYLSVLFLNIIDI